MTTPSRTELRNRLAAFPDLLGTAVMRAGGGPIPEGEWGPADVVRHLIATEVEVYHARLDQLSMERLPRWPWVEPPPWAERPNASLIELLTLHASRRGQTIARVDALDDAGWARTGIHETYGTLDVAGLLQIAVDHDEEHLAALG